jgi:hypothetical protein
MHIRRFGYNAVAVLAYFAIAAVAAFAVATELTIGVAAGTFLVNVARLAANLVRVATSALTASLIRIAEIRSICICTTFLSGRIVTGAAATTLFGTTVPYPYAVFTSITGWLRRKTTR